MFKYQKERLKNGLRLITVPMKGIKSVTVLVSVGAGSRQEKRQENGLAHFLEHMLFKGTKKRPTASDISSTIDSIGGQLNAHTGKESTSFYVKCSAKHLPLSLDLLSDMLTNSLLEPGEIEKEKGVIAEEINLHHDTPVAKVSEVFDSLLYGSGPLGRPVIGRRENIRNLKREDFVRFIKRFYTPMNMVMGIAGAVGEKKKIKNLVGKYFGRLEKSDTAGSDLLKKFTAKQRKPAIKIDYQKTQQAHFCLGVRAFKRTHPDRYALSVLATILGGNMSSRLVTEVREKRGLAYYIKAYNGRFKETGHLSIQAGTDIHKIGEAIEVILAEYKKIPNSKFQISNLELERAKEYLKGRLVLELEDSHSVASMYAASELLEGRTRTPEEIIKKIEAVTEDDILRVAKKLFKPQNLNLAVIGPYQKKPRFAKILKL